MKRNAWLVRLGLISASALALALLVLPLRMRTRAQGNHSPVHMTTDWSNRHMIFSPPHSTIDGLKLQAQARYLHQSLRRNAAAGRRLSSNEFQAQLQQSGQQDPSHTDWAMPLPSGATVGDGMFPSKWDFDITTPPDCLNDYVVFNTSLVGSASSPSIVAFDELYSTQGSAGGFCNQNGPSVKWAYNTNASGDTTGSVVTSTVISGDGTKVAFVETRTNANGGAILHVLKWKPGNSSAIDGTIAAPATPQNVYTNTNSGNGANTPWSTCPAAQSCIINITFGNAQADTDSPPYYDYGTDILYVGDDNGVLHKFVGIFNGTPGEVTSGNWPVTVHSGTKLTGPVHDLNSNNIFVADSSGILSYVLESGSTTGACASGTAPCLGTPSQSLGGAILDPPIVDGTNQTVFVFDGTGSSGAEVLQTDTALNVLQTVGLGSAGSLSIPIHAGIFDDAYFTSAFPNIKGHLLVCGKDSGGADSPELYQIGFNSRSAILNSTPNGAPLSGLTTGGAECSPVSEIFNTPTSTDWIFFSVTKNAAQTGCGTGGCVMSVNLTAAGSTWPPPAGVAHTAPASGGTSGITFDNVADTTTYPQASSIYFSYLSDSSGGSINVNNADFLSPPCNAASNAGCNLSIVGGDPVWWSPPPNGVAGWFPSGAGVLTSDPAIMATAPDGSDQVGYVFAGGYTIQMLDGNCGSGPSCPGGNTNVVLAAGTTYTVSVNVGSRTDIGGTTGIVILQATQNGSSGPFTNLAENSAVLSSGGQWTTVTVSYTVPLGSPVVGHNLAIALAATGNEALFNNLQAEVGTGASCNGMSDVGCDVKLTQSALN